jgi:large subunit ribosomal protein L10
MKNRDEKKKDFEALQKDFTKTPHVFVNGFEKLTVAQDFELRKIIRGAGANYKVIKNNIAEKASEGTPAEKLMKDLKGMTSIAYTGADPVALAKALTAYAKSVPTFTFKAGMVEGRVIDIKSINDLANMPPKEELIAKVMFLINSSAQRLAVSLNGVARNLAVALNEAIKESKFKE